MWIGHIFGGDIKGREPVWDSRSHFFIAKTFGKEHLKIRFSRNRNAWALYAKSMCRNTFRDTRLVSFLAY